MRPIQVLTLFLNLANLVLFGVVVYFLRKASKKINETRKIQEEIDRMLDQSSQSPPADS